MDDVLYGYFKDECEGHHLISFASLAPKFYSIQTVQNLETQEGLQETIKLRGFTLRQSRHDASAVTHTLFCQYAHKLLKKGSRCHHILGQFNIRTRKRDRQIISCVEAKTLRNDIFNKRVLNNAFVLKYFENGAPDETSNIQSPHQIITQLNNQASLTLPYGFSKTLQKKLNEKIVLKQ